MRLPKFLTDTAPIGAVLKAGAAGEQLLRDEIKQRNARTSVETADGEGLSLWEADYGLPDGTNLDSILRRGRISGAMAGGQTLTPDRLKALAVNVARADAGEIHEDFEDNSVELTAVHTGRLPENAGMEALCLTLDHQKPAHLKIDAVPCAALTLDRAEAHHGGLLRIIYATAPEVA